MTADSSDTVFIVSDDFLDGRRVGLLEPLCNRRSFNLTDIAARGLSVSSIEVVLSFRDLGVSRLVVCILEGCGILESRLRFGLVGHESSWKRALEIMVT